MNPAFRTSSPQPSTYESHHDPQNTFDVETPRRQPITSPTPETTRTPQEVAQANHAPPPPASGHQARPGTQGGPPPGQVEALPTVPHNEYPMDGMTMYCRTAPPPSSDRSSAASPGRPISRDSQSDDSNPTSSSSYEPSNGKQSPMKLGALPATANAENDKQVLMRPKSGFFQNHSPFRRKSKHEREYRPVDSSNVTAPGEHRGTTLTAPSRTGMAGSTHLTQSPTRSGRESQGMLLESRHQSRSPEPVDPRANFQLNVGNNVFDVASPDARPSATGNPSSQTQDALDPIAQALAELKGVGKQSSARLSADRYHGIQTPAPSVAASSSTAAKRPGASPTRQTTPPPSYDQPTRRLDAPQPAFTSAQMQQTRQKYVDQKQNMFGDSAGTLSPVRTDAHTHTQSRPRAGGSTRNSGYGVPRAVSPIPPRGVSPRPEAYAVGEQRQGYRSMSPNPYHRSVRGQHPSRSPPKRDSDRRYAPSEKQRTDHHRRGSADVVSTQLQLSPALENGYDDPAHGRGRHVAVDRPMTYYGGSGRDHPSTQVQRSPAEGRVRSRSINDGRQFNQDGIPILHHGKHHDDART